MDDQDTGSQERKKGQQAMSLVLPSYALITPARNEEAYIELTLRSVVQQTVKPVRWVVVSDGSTDKTDNIVKRYAEQYEWLRLLRLPERKERHFAAKVMAFRAGYEALRDVPYDVVGNLDADISFDSDYFEFLLGRLAENPRLGVVGTPFMEAGRTYDFRYASVQHVSGACQVFRRRCFDEIGGYEPIRGGAIDWVAVTTARMKGWQTRTFLEKVCQHHRPIGTGTGGVLSAHFKQGRKDYYVGGHPLWEMCRSVHRMRSRPYVLGGLWLFAGFVWSALARVESPVSREVRVFHRREQDERLRRLFSFRCRASDKKARGSNEKGDCR